MRTLLPKTNTSMTHAVSRAQVCEGITKKTQTTVACKGCRRRKVKCYGKPRCRRCLLSDQECHFPTSRYSHGVIAKELERIEQNCQSALSVIDSIRVAEGSDLEETVERIRSSNSVRSFMESVGEAKLLLQLKEFEIEGT